MNSAINADHLRQLLVVAKMLRKFAPGDALFETAATALEDRARRMTLGDPVPVQPLNIVC